MEPEFCRDCPIFPRPQECGVFRTSGQELIEYARRPDERCQVKDED